MMMHPVRRIGLLARSVLAVLTALGASLVMAAAPAHAVAPGRYIHQYCDEILHDVYGRFGVHYCWGFIYSGSEPGQGNRLHGYVSLRYADHASGPLPNIYYGLTVTLDLKGRSGTTYASRRETVRGINKTLTFDTGPSTCHRTNGSIYVSNPLISIIWMDNNVSSFHPGDYSASALGGDSPGNYNIGICTNTNREVDLS